MGSNLRCCRGRPRAAFRSRLACSAIRTRTAFSSCRRTSRAVTGCFKPMMCWSRTTTTPPTLEGNTVSTQGLGTTITRIRPNGDRSVFFNSTAMGVTGFTNALDIIPHGFIFAGTVPTTDGTSAHCSRRPGLIINGQGEQVGTIPVGDGTHPGIYGPWGSTINMQKNGNVQYFVANCLAPVPGHPGTFQGTIVRYEISFNHKGMMEMSTRFRSHRDTLPDLIPRRSSPDPQVSLTIQRPTRSMSRVKATTKSSPLRTLRPRPPTMAPARSSTTIRRICMARLG